MNTLTLTEQVRTAHRESKLAADYVAELAGMLPEGHPGRCHLDTAIRHVQAAAQLAEQAAAALERCDNQAVAYAVMSGANAYRNAMNAADEAARHLMKGQS